MRKALSQIFFGVAYCFNAVGVSLFNVALRIEAPLSCSHTIWAVNEEGATCEGCGIFEEER